MAKRNEGKIYVSADVRDARRALRQLEKDATGFGIAARRVGRAIKYAFHGNLRQAKREMKDAWHALGRMGRAAMWAGGVMTAAFYGIQRAVKSAFAAYGPYMKAISQVKRLTGMTAEQASTLVGEWKLSGIELKKGATAARFFAKNLDAARQGANAQVETFKRLGVALKDGNGNWRDGASVMEDVRSAFSEIKDPIERSALMLKLFGRSGTDLAKWLTASNAKIREFRDYLKDVGLVMSEQTLKDFGAFNENKRKLALGWEAIKVSAAAALVPIANAIIPKVIEVIKRMAGWFGRFRSTVEKKGLKEAILTMVPGARAVTSAIQKMRDWWGRNSESIKKMAAIAGKALSGLVAVIQSIIGAIQRLVGWIKDAIDWFRRLGGAKSSAEGTGGATTGGGGGGGGGTGGGVGIRVLPKTAPAIAPATTPVLGGPTNISIPILLDGREIASYTVDLMAGQARRLARGMA